MAFGLSKCAIGSFSNRQQAESALSILQHSDFPMGKIAVLAQNTNPNDTIASSEYEFIRKKTVEAVIKGGLLLGLLGSVIGLFLGFGLLGTPNTESATTFAPMPTLLGGILTGGLYGLLGGVFLGAILGNGTARRQTKAYAERLNQGNYLVIVKGSEDEIHQAESVLSNQGIQDWGIYPTV